MSRPGIVVEDGSETAAARAAIEADPALTPRQRRTLLEVYDALLSAGPAPRQRKRRSAPAPGAAEAGADAEHEGR